MYTRSKPQGVKHIKKRLNETDSIRLNNEQTELFVREWNNATSEGLYKMGPEFWIIVKLKNDSIRKFRTNSNLIKEKNFRVLLENIFFGRRVWAHRSCR